MSNFSLEKKTLIIKVPKLMSDSQEKFRSFFNDLHKSIKDREDLREEEKVISFEVVLKENYFHYQIILSSKIVSIVKSLLYSRFNDIEIIEESSPVLTGVAQKLIAEFKLKRSNFLPLKTEFSSIDDPYVVLSAILSKLKHFDEGVILQLILCPVSESWSRQFLREKFYFFIAAINRIKIFFEKPFLEKEFINYYEEIKKKFDTSRFLGNLRVLAYGKTQDNIKENFDLILKSLDKFKNSDVNSLLKVRSDKQKLYNLFALRLLSSRKMILNVQEVAAIFRFPDSTLQISSVYQTSSKKIEPPKDLPTGNLLEVANVSSFGMTNFRDSHLQFGIKREDRNKHLYIIGKTGMGKSRLIELLAISDIYQGKGLGIIDPHGDLASEIIKFIPENRMADVIYFNPADSQYPIGFNPLECHSPEAKHQVVTGFVAIFKKLFAANWTNRLEHMLRFTVLALVETGDSTVVDIVKLLTDVSFRQATIAKLEDPVVKNFWTHEFASWNEKFDNEAIVPLINQVGQFIANDYIRNVVSQKKSAIDFYEAMNSGKIIIMNLAKGKLGEDNASLLGSMVITKIQEAVMARVNLPESERKEFYLYVDEFQNFATEAFNEILSEGRKFNLSLTIAHQYLDQLSESIRKTVFGNVGSFICFRIGSEDAHFLSHEFVPQITSDDLINLNFREMYLKLSVNGKTSTPFSASTISVPQPKQDRSQMVIEASRKTYATTKEKIDELFTQNRESTQLIYKEETVKSKDNIFEEPIV